MPPLVFLKLGGSLITVKTQKNTIRRDALLQIARVIQRARADLPGLELLIGHGSGSFGHFAAQESGFGRPGNWEAYAATGAAAARLNRQVVDLFLGENLPVVSIQPSASTCCRDGELFDLSDYPIRQALLRGLVPVIYGDVSFDETLGCTIASTEMIFSLLAARLGPARLLLAGELEGIFTADPHRDPHARLLPELTPSLLSTLQPEISASHAPDVTGGMRDKVRRMLALSAQFPGLEIRVIGASAMHTALVEPAAAVGTRLYAQ